MRSPRAALVLLILSGPASAALYGQVSTVTFDHISTADGLSQSAVNAILQDRQGFMWFGTQDGLNRYDGYTFAVYRNTPSDSQSISSNYIWCLLEDRDGNIWAGTLSNGLNCLRRDENRFVRYLHDPTDSTSLSANNVTALCQDADGTIWVGTWGGGLDRLDPRTGRFTHFRHLQHDANSLPGNLVRCLYPDSSGLLWVGTWAGLTAFNTRTGVFVWYLHDPHDPASLSGDEVTFISRDSRRNLWIGTLDGGLNLFDPSRKSFLHYRHARQETRGPGSNEILSMCEDRSGHLWFGTSNAGVSRLNPGTGHFTLFRQDPSKPRALCSDWVTALYADRAGEIWIGTNDAGMSKYDPNRPQFNSIMAYAGTHRGLSHNVVRAVLEDRKSTLWVGTAGGGLDRYDQKTREFINYRHSEDDPRSISDNSIMALFEDFTGALWIGTGAGGLDRFEPATGTFVRYQERGAGHRTISDNSIMSIAEGRNRELWVGTTGGGLNYYDRKHDTFLPFVPGATGNPGSYTNIWAIHEDRRGILWIGTWGEGLVRYDKSTGAVRRFQHDENEPSTLSDNTVWSIYEDPAGILWLGTWGGGLERYDPRLNTFTHFTEANGLPNNVVYGALPDGDGKLWLSTNDGLSQFDPSTGTCINYGEHDGLQGREFNQGAYCRGRDGTLYFGGNHGLTAFRPTGIRINPLPPPVVLTSFKIFEREAPLDRPISDIDEINLSYRDDFIAFEFSALDFSAPRKNQYAYRLEGFDREWIYCGTRRYAAYTGLQGGTYVFRVKGSNSDGVWNDAGTAVRIVVQPPFWRTRWFLFSSVAVVLFLLYSLYRYRVRQLVEMERLRTRIAYDLHDELASNLSSIAVFSNLVQTAGPTGASLPPDQMKLLERITALAQDSVTSIRDIIWAIDPKPESAYDLLLRLKDFTIPLCRVQNIHLEFGGPIRENLPPHNLTPEQRKHLWLLLKEVVTNAIRHSRCTRLTVQEEYSSGVLHVVVKDDGAGFDSHTPSPGRGMRTMTMRALYLAGALSLSSVPGEGTTVDLTVRL